MSEKQYPITEAKIEDLRSRGIIPNSSFLISIFIVIIFGFVFFKMITDVQIINEKYYIEVASSIGHKVFLDSLQQYSLFIVLHLFTACILIFIVTILFHRFLFKPQLLNINRQEIKLSKRVILFFCSILFGLISILIFYTMLKNIFFVEDYSFKLISSFDNGNKSYLDQLNKIYIIYIPYLVTVTTYLVSIGIVAFCFSCLDFRKENAMTREEMLAEIDKSPINLSDHMGG